MSAIIEARQERLNAAHEYLRTRGWLTVREIAAGLAGGDEWAEHRLTRRRQVQVQLNRLYVLGMAERRRTGDGNEYEWRALFDEGRIVDAVRAYCASSLAASDPADGPRVAAQRDVWRHVIALLDGEAGDELG